MLYWWSKFVLLGPLLRLFCRPTIEGLEHIPARGGAIARARYRERSRRALTGSLATGSPNA